MYPVKIYNGQGELMNTIEPKELIKLNDENIKKISMRGALRRKKREELVKKCDQCKKEFKTFDSREKRCSKECKAKRNRKIAKRDCVVCGAEFQPKSNAVKYCGNPCNFYTNKGTDR